MRVLVSGAAGQIGYSLLYRIASGEMLGLNQPVTLHLLEIPQMLNALKGVEMELEDCAYPLLQGIKTGSDARELFDGVDIAILVGAKPRGKGMERKDLLKDNAKIFVDQGKAIQGKPKVLVVGNPANTNALVLAHNAKDLPKENIRSMMRLDQNRAITQLAKKAKVKTSDVTHMVVYGNHSPTMVPDYHNAKIQGKGVEEVLRDQAWLQGEFMNTVKKRGAQIIEARGLSSAASAANAAIDSIKDWLRPGDDWVSAGVYCQKRDLFFGQALQGNRVVEGLKFDPFIEKMLLETERELIEEREVCL